MAAVLVAGIAVSPWVSTGTLGAGGAVVTAGVVDGRSFSRFFSSVRKKAFNVVRSALFGLHRSGETGLCSQTGQLSGSDDWPEGCC